MSRTIIGVLLLMSSAAGFCQVPHFEHLPLTKRNELVHAHTLFQDRQGYMWFGTNNGLFKSDGITITQYSDSLPDLKVTAIAQDSLGRIWIGHGNGSIGYLENGSFRRFIPPEGETTHPISDILFDSRNVLWFATLDDGLYYFMEKRLFRLDESEGLPDLYVYDIAEDQEGIVWAGTDGGLVQCQLGAREVTTRVLDTGDGLPDNIIKKVVVQNGGLLLGTEDAGIVRFEYSSGVNSIDARMTPLIPGPWTFGTFADFLPDDDKVWIASQRGLILYHIDDKRQEHFGALSGAGFTTILALLKDREGNIWAGTRSDVMHGRSDQLEFIERYDPLQETNTVAVAVDPQETLWFATGEGLFARSIDGNGRPVIRRPLAGTPYQKFTVISLYADKDGWIWAGLYGEGALRIHSRTGSIRHLNHELQNGNVLNISGKGNTVWLATLGGGTRVRYSGDKLEIRNFTSKDGLVSAYIYQAFIDSRDRVWFATDGKGADMLDDTGFHHFQKGLGTKVVYGFAEDHNGTIWLNVQGEGLYRLNGDSLEPFDAGGRRLRDNNISCFHATASGNLFIMHDLGIDIIDIDHDRVVFFGEESGIRNHIPNLNAVSSGNHGQLYVGTEGGIIRFAERAGEYSAGPTPIIEEFRVQNRPAGRDEAASLNYNQNDITIRYTGLWFQNPSGVSYRYKLDSFDNEWISSQDNSVTYSRLAPGPYTFRLQASDNGDFNAATEVSVSFEISPPFWQTWWFFVMMGLILVFSARMIILYRERRLRKEKLVLEARVAERTLEIIKKTNEINDQAEKIRAINENLEELVRQRTHELEKKNQALSEYAFLNAHELRAPVASILGLIQLIESGNADEEKREYMEHLRASADKLDKVVRSIGKAIEKGDTEQ